MWAILTEDEDFKFLMGGEGAVGGREHKDISILYYYRVTHNCTEGKFHGREASERNSTSEPGLQTVCVCEQ